MAQVDQSALHNFSDGETVTEQMLDQNFEVLRVANNDNYTQILAIKNAQTTVLVYIGTSYPSNPSPGQLCFRTDIGTTGQLKIYNGSAWVDAESSITTASKLLLGATSYPPALDASVSTVALRDALGAITASNFTTPFNSFDDGTGTASVKALKINGQAVAPSNVTNPLFWLKR